MFYVLSWIVVACVLALWSLTAAALHAVAVWALSNADALGGASSGLGRLALPDWLAPWVPVEAVQAMAQIVQSLGPRIDSLLQAAPSLAGAVTAVAWAVWGLGGLLLLLLGAGLHLLIAAWRRRGRSGAVANVRPTMAPGWRA